MSLKSVVLVLALVASVYGQGTETDLLSQARRRTQAQAIGSICPTAVDALSSSIKIPTGVEIDYRTIRTPCIRIERRRVAGIRVRVPVAATCDNRVPSGASIKYEEKSLSSMIGGDVTRTLEASCECFKLADKILREGLQNSFESVHYSLAISAALTSGLKVQNCLIDLGLNVQEPDKDNVLAEIRDGRGASLYRVTELEEIDLAFYQKENSADRLADDFVALKDDIVDRINTVTSAVTDRMNVLERVPQLLRKTRADLEACASENKTSVEQSRIAQLDEMAGKIERLTTLMDTVPAVLDALQAAEDLYKLMNYRETIAEAISSGQAPDLPSMVEGLKGGTKVAEAFEQVKSLFTDFDDVLFDVTLLESIPEKIPSEMQDCMRRRGENAFTDLDTASLGVPDLREMADKIIVTNLEVRGGVASYSRFIDISVPMPCSRMEDKCFEVKEIGFKQCVEWPEFYKCTYEKEVPLPNHHIPWVGFYLYGRS
ncbi:unnamed protein product [Vitrella brassicaformis CCMP3155]|uniref:Uncharacterized protein n=1 Tax=Vitrella brassicaformis (strain CCMP3155) TaxID=1169540 RepID=A0A0G4H0E6_VITBC|nr:unnamed protein product [Vitrella brassicaformis CCMP3155]|eukprot:CEM36883.1 unnamed protein product [Vitrella brassicaformis CCMP3155]